MPEEYTTRELGIMFEEIRSFLTRIEDQTKKTNGKVAEIERWRLENMETIAAFKKKAEEYRTCVDWVKEQMESDKEEKRVIRSNSWATLFSFLYKASVFVFMSALAWWVYKVK